MVNKVDQIGSSPVSGGGVKIGAAISSGLAAKEALSNYAVATEEGNRNDQLKSANKFGAHVSSTFASVTSVVGKTAVWAGAALGTVVIIGSISQAFTALMYLYLTAGSAAALYNILKFQGLLPKPIPIKEDPLKSPEDFEEAVRKLSLLADHPEDKERKKVRAFFTSRASAETLELASNFLDRIGKEEVGGNRFTEMTESQKRDYLKKNIPELNAILSEIQGATRRQIIKRSLLLLVSLLGLAVAVAMVAMPPLTLFTALAIACGILIYLLSIRRLPGPLHVIHEKVQQWRKPEETLAR